MKTELKKIKEIFNIFTNKDCQDKLYSHQLSNNQNMKTKLK